MYAIKALLAFVGAFLAALLMEWTDTDPLQARDFVTALVAALVTGGFVYAVPNRNAARSRSNA